jgi:DUF2075 family protein
MNDNETLIAELENELNILMGRLICGMYDLIEDEELMGKIKELYSQLNECYNVT